MCEKLGYNNNINLLPMIKGRSILKFKNEITQIISIQGLIKSLKTTLWAANMDYFIKNKKKIKTFIEKPAHQFMFTIIYNCSKLIRFYQVIQD